MAIKSYIDKDGKKKWKINVYLGIDPLTGKKKYTNRIGFKTEKQAKLKEAQLITGIEKIEKKQPTFTEIYEMWFDTYQDEVKDSTLAATKDIFRLHILPNFGDYLIDKIQYSHIQKWVKEKAKTHVKYKEFHGYLESVIVYAKSKGFRSDNPCEGISFPTKIAKKGKKIEVIWDRNQLSYFLNYVEENRPLRDFAMFRLLAYSGMRRGEMLALEWNDLSFLDGILTINKSRKVVSNPRHIEGSKEPRKIETTGDTKTGDDRTIKLDKKTIDILYKWRVEQTKLVGSQKLMFTNTNGKCMLLNHPLKILNSILDKIDLIDGVNLTRIDVHRFRHIHTTMLILSNKSKNSLGAIMNRLGHADITTTLNIYNHIMKEEKVDVLESFIEYIDEAV